VHYEYFKYIDTLFMSTTLYLTSCFFGTVLILINMVTQLVVLILWREQDWMLLLLLVDSRSDLSLLWFASWQIWSHESYSCFCGEDMFWMFFTSLDSSHSNIIFLTL